MSASPPFPDRVTALFEVLLCSGFPTQILLIGVLTAAGYQPVGQALTLGYVVALSLGDTVLLVGLIAVFLKARNEPLREVFLGRRSVGGEAMAGVPLVLVALGIGLGTILLLQEVAPWLHTVERNPLQELIRTPLDAVLFAAVVVVAGGVREELQRAFLLRRFESHLGGPIVGVIVASSAFGAGHLLQGADAAVTTAILGAFWGATYLYRRSVVAPIVSHSGFNLIQLVAFGT